jgi:anti-anti-sigma factor
MGSGRRRQRDEPVIEVSKQGDAVVVRLGGELDLSTAGEVRRALFDSATASSGRVVVDLAEVEFMDSTALAILLEVRGRLREGERLLLAAPGLEARRALELSGLDRYFSVHPTVEEALAAAD